MAVKPFKTYEMARPMYKVKHIDITPNWGYSRMHITFDVQMSIDQEDPTKVYVDIDHFNEEHFTGTESKGGFWDAFLLAWGPDDAKVYDYCGEMVSWTQPGKTVYSKPRKIIKQPEVGNVEDIVLSELRDNYGNIIDEHNAIAGYALWNNRTTSPGAKSDWFKNLGINPEGDSQTHHEFTFSDGNIPNDFKFIVSYGRSLHWEYKNHQCLQQMGGNNENDVNTHVCWESNNDLVNLSPDDFEPWDYYPWAICKKDFNAEDPWQSCNRFGEKDPEDRTGRLKRKLHDGSWEGVLNDFRNGQDRKKHGQIYKGQTKQGEWKKSPLIGNNQSGHDQE